MGVPEAGVWVDGDLKEVEAACDSFAYWFSVAKGPECVIDAVDLVGKRGGR